MTPPALAETRSDAGAFPLAPAEWNAAWEADAAATMFHRPEFLRSWWEELAAHETPHTVVVGSGERPEGLAFCVVRDDTLRFLGDPEVTDYLGPIGGDAEAVAAGFVEAAGRLPGWHTAELSCLAADTGWAEALAAAAREAGWQVEERRQDVCPRVSIPDGGFEAYLEALPGKLRHEIRRKERRLARETGEYTVRLSDATTLDADLDRFFEMHRGSQGEKGKFLHEGMTGFFTRIARAFDATGDLRLSWLEIGGESLAAILSFADRGTWRVYNSAYDHRKRELGPGMVLMGESIRLAAAEGCRTVDLLRGAEPYKYRFGAVDVPLVQLVAQRSEEAVEVVDARHV